MNVTYILELSLGYQKVQPISGQSKETMTSLAPGVTGAKARCV